MSLSSPLLKQVVLVSGATLGAICFVVLSFSVFSYQFNRRYDGRLYQHLSINQIDIGGLTPEEARIRVEQTIQQALAEGIRLRVGQKTLSLSSQEIISSHLITYDVEGALAKAQQTGRSGSFFRKAYVRFQLARRPRTVPLSAELEPEKIKNYFASSTARLLPQAQDAQLLIIASNTEPSQIRIQPEETGQAIDWKRVLEIMDQQTQALRFTTIDAPLLTLQPRWREADMAPLKPQAETWLSYAPFFLSAEGRSFKVDALTVASWIKTTSGERPELELNQEQLRTTLDGWLAGLIQPAKEGFIQIEDGKLKTFIAPEEGVEVDIAKTRQTILDHWANATSSLPITLVNVNPKINGDDAEALGIRQVIGVGRSNFSGSPTNRRYNIKLGAQRVHGSLIAPEGEFSMLKTLGPVDGAHGWLPELVIKGNKTTPEFGGGLCQIGTTAFRGAMSSGLVISERRNHSYRVRYYEPAGTDATIYEPAPDFKFKNDTGHWVLITTKVVGDNVAFTFWGTSDGRVATIGKSQIYNIVPAPPKKTIETTDLPPGKVKCTEVAHAGATAKVDYTVAYPNGENKTVTFTSVYRPWGAVCLVGAANPSTPSGTGTVDETGVNNPN